MSSEPLIPPHGGYRNLKSFQLAQLCYDITVRFCDRYVDKYSRTRDQMVQAARSGVQNIAEGSKASGTSKKTELKLTNVARASLEELRLDYEDYLRHNRLVQWAPTEPLRKQLVGARCQTAEDVASWINKIHNQADGKARFDELAANAALVLIGVSCSLLDRQIKSQENKFVNEGGFTERLYRVRKNHRDSQ